MRDIGKNIRELRLRKHMTQDALAESLFVTRQTVSNYETGKSRPDVDMLVKISEIFDCDVNHLLYGAPEEKKNTMLRSLLIAIVLCILSGLSLLFSVELEKMARYWQSGVTVTLKLIVQPFFLLFETLSAMLYACPLEQMRKADENGNIRVSERDGRQAWPQRS